MVDIKEFFKRDKFAEHCGMELVDVSPGSAKAEMMVKKEHLNGLNTVHGGALFTLADLAFGAAANSYGMATMAINVSITYMTAVTKGKVTAVAREVSRNPKLSTYTIDIFNDEGELVAVFQGLAYQKRQSLDEFI
ncbi:MAG TPA: PaaI family thioesterase [Methanobacterium sp.]|jgi:acyl-CoA thioesterase|nr:MAG: PaaI family thioesterase [Methanobacterium sp.]HOI71382.1 PaaI family thioesterase [Methanobacterium sp.]